MADAGPGLDDAAMRLGAALADGAKASADGAGLALVETDGPAVEDPGGETDGGAQVVTSVTLARSATMLPPIAGCRFMVHLTFSSTTCYATEQAAAQTFQHAVDRVEHDVGERLQVVVPAHAGEHADHQPGPRRAGHLQVGR